MVVALHRQEIREATGFAERSAAPFGRCACVVCLCGEVVRRRLARHCPCALAAASSISSCCARCFRNAADLIGRIFGLHSTGVDACVSDMTNPVVGNT
jgi:hypothetical protein